MKTLRDLLVLLIGGMLGGCISGGFVDHSTAQQAEDDSKVFEKLRVRQIELVDKDGKVAGGLGAGGGGRNQSAYLFLGMQEQEGERATGIQMRYITPGDDRNERRRSSIEIHHGGTAQRMSLEADRMILDDQALLVDAKDGLAKKMFVMADGLWTQGVGSWSLRSAQDAHAIDACIFSLGEEFGRPGIRFRVPIDKSKPAELKFFDPEGKIIATYPESKK